MWYLKERPEIQFDSIRELAEYMDRNKMTGSFTFCNLECVDGDDLIDKLMEEADDLRDEKKIIN